MRVKGYVRISLSLNVYDLETDAVWIDSNGRVRTCGGEEFFSDWCDNWVIGIGELTGASVEAEDLELEDGEEELDSGLDEED